MQTGTEAQLLEREAELATVDQLLEAAAEGRGSACVVEGLAGIGKSTLLAEAAERAAKSGFEVLTASGHEAEQDFASECACSSSSGWWTRTGAARP